MRNSKRVVVAGLASILVVSVCGNASRAQDDRNDAKTKKIRIVTVVKRTGIGWFERMEEGIKQFAAQNGVDATMTSADDADPQKQADIIRKLIGEKPDAITVVPNSPEALEEVLKQARAAGIKVVTHEASNQVNTDVDIEAFDNLAYGSNLMDELASCMGGSGKYVAFVGHTTARSHMRWATGAFGARSKSIRRWSAFLRRLKPPSASKPPIRRRRSCWQNILTSRASKAAQSWMWRKWTGSPGGRDSGQDLRHGNEPAIGCGRIPERRRG